jgi:hypothetical protein
MGLSAAAIAGYACSCVPFDAKWWVDHASEIVAIEVTSVDAANPLKVDWGSNHNIKGVRVSYRALETIKGAPRTAGTFIEVGFEFACNPGFQPSHTYIVFLTDPTEDKIGLCHTAQATPDNLRQLRAAQRSENR